MTRTRSFRAIPEHIDPVGHAADVIAEDPSDLDLVVAELHRLNLAGRLNDFTSSLLAQYARKGTLSDKQVAAMMRGMNKAPREDKPKDVIVTEPGVYERDDVVYVVKFTKDKQRLYAKRIRELNSTRLTEAGTIVDIEFDYAPGAVYRLRPEDKMSLERAKEYTIRYGRCIVCGRNLKKAESVERGIGPVCIKSFA